MILNKTETKTNIRRICNVKDFINNTFLKKFPHNHTLICHIISTFIIESPAFQFI